MRAKDTGDLGCDKGFAARWRLAIKQNAVASVNAGRFTVINCRPVSKQRGDGTGAARIKRRGFALRHFLHEAVKFGARRLLETRLFLQPTDSDRFVQTQRAKAVGVGGVYERSRRRSEATDRHRA